LTSTARKVPAWLEEMTKKYVAGVAHMFSLYFNVGDYVEANHLLRGYLANVMSKMWNCDIVAFYNRTEGITFVEPKMRTDFIALLGLNEQANEAAAYLPPSAVPGADDITLPKDPVSALAYLEKAMQLSGTGADDKRVGVILDYVEAIAPEGDFGAMGPEDRSVVVTLQRWAKDSRMMKAGTPIILLSANQSDIHGAIRASSSRIASIMVPLPNEDERLGYIQWLLETMKDIVLDLSPREFARATGGLTLTQIEDVVLNAEILDRPVSFDLVRETKKEIFSTAFRDVLQVLEPQKGFEIIGGLEHVKTFFRNSVIKPIRAGNKTRVPMGVLLLGAAGTGKTAVAESTAFESGINCVVLNPAKIYDKYVGGTERNLEKALNAIDSLKPCIVFVDEIDQAVKRGGGGDSGVSDRVFKRLLEFMSDTRHRGEVVFLAASNRPDLIDAALKRPGRFDKKIPFTVPDDPEREAIFKAMFIKYGLKADVDDFTYVVKGTSGYTGAEIEAITLTAYEIAQDRGSDTITTEDLNQAVDVIRPSTSDIEYMTLLAMREVNDLRLVPPQYREFVTNKSTLQARLKETEPVETVTRGRRSVG